MTQVASVPGAAVPRATAAAMSRALAARISGTRERSAAAAARNASFFCVVGARASTAAAARAALPNCCISPCKGSTVCLTAVTADAPNGNSYKGRDHMRFFGCGEGRRTRIGHL